MEGDAGASRLNPTDPEATDEDSQESSEATARIRKNPRTEPTR